MQCPEEDAGVYTGRRRHESMRVFSNWLEEDKVRDCITPLQLYVFLVETRKHGSTLQLDEDEVIKSFNPLRLDVFHTLRGMTHGSDCRPRLPEVPKRE